MAMSIAMLVGIVGLGGTLVLRSMPRMLQSIVICVAVTNTLAIAMRVRMGMLRCNSCI